MSKRRRIIATTCLLGALMLALVAFSAGVDPTASVRGHIAAAWDTRHGRYNLLTYGFTSHPDVDRIVRRRYAGASVISVAGCIVTPRLINYTRAYNDYSEQAAVHHFGHNIFDEAFRDAEADDDPNHPPAHR